MEHKEPNIPNKFLSPYNPGEVEQKLYETWLAEGFFNPDECIKKGFTNADAPVFSMVLPPPNVTGVLHMGHALMLTIEDIMARYKRMCGHSTLWIPGTDHAAIATQSKVEGIIYKEEGKRRHDLGREELLRRVNEYAQASHDTIVNQTKRMGASLDWSREAYTLDSKRHEAVFEAFKRMYDDGLIYRKYRIVNWDPKGQTTISDDELVYTEGTGKFYTFKYSKDFPISIATTRPETKVGDVAVAVHPEDARYQQFIGKKYDIDFAGEKINITIVGDDAVDPAFGTGAVGVTPAHSVIDWEIAERHNLPVVPVINEYAKMSVKSELLNGKKTSEAREIVVNWLREQNLLEKEETIPQNLATAERTGGIVEPLPKLQWWVAVNKPFVIKESHIKGIESSSTVTLKDLMLSVTANGETEMLPERFGKIYEHWIKNLRDWCISRQIWFGHRVPAWYKLEPTTDNPQQTTGEIRISKTSPGEGWIQDEDTLDTWFSSGLWTFSTLGWPEETKDFKTYHPTTVLETGYDILPFWVARMILMSTYLLGITPFKTVYFNGIVRNADGSKMSKSKGAIDPLDMCDKYGTDAVRMSLIVGAGPGNDTRMSEDKIRAYKNFANKLWNITRFVLSSTEGETLEPTFIAHSAKDAELIARRDAFLKEITGEMEDFKYYLVSEKIYHYAWTEFADVILEESKTIFASGTDAEKKSRKQFLLSTLTIILKILHPFTPFVTEEIWSSMPVENKKNAPS